MKRSDIFSIIIIATVGTLFSYFAVNSFLGNPDDESAVITTINAISPNLVKPDPELFNKDAINPTVEVMIDGCKDLDYNGIIDYAELVACGKIKPEEAEQVYTCPDGTVVLEEAQCPQQTQEPEEQEQSQSDNLLLCPDGTKRVASLADCNKDETSGE